MSQVRVSEIKNVIIEPCVPKNPVCLRWMNKSGAWDQYVFGHTQTEGLDTFIAVITNTPVEDYETANTVQEAHGRRSVDKMVLGADNLDTNRINGIKGILDNAKCLILIEWNPPTAPVWRTVIVEPGTFSTFETGQTKQRCEFTIQFPENNIQQL